MSAPRVVMVTGAFGNVGTSTLAAALGAGCRVLTFDLDTKVNRRRAARQRSRRMDSVWGDILDADAVGAAVSRSDAVIHLAALIPPGSDRDTARTWAVNVDGTRTVVDAVAAAPSRPRLVHASSLSVYGRTQHLEPPRRVDDPLDPCDFYGRTKAAAEAIVRSSGIDWVILRLGAVLPLRLPTVIDPIMFEVPLTDRIEFVHTRDVGIAAVVATSHPEVVGRTLNIGGGPGSQLLQRQLVARPLAALGVRMLPDEAFTTTPFHADWLDTEESQRLLGYQHRTFDDYVTEVGRRYRWRRPATVLASALVLRKMLAASPYWRSHLEASGLVR